MKVYGRSYRTPGHERGMTTLGMLILAAFIGMFAFGAIRLAPVYLNFFKVKGVIDGVQQEFDGQNPSRAAIRTSINRRFEVESVSVVSNTDIKVTPDDGGFLVEASYDHTTPYIGNLYFTVRFDKRVLVRR